MNQKKDAIMKNPYKELSPYLESDASRFKGRTLEIEEMYESFDRNEYLVCHADSGEGKSSIIEAGLIPKMKENNYFPIRVIFNSDEHYKKNNVDFDEVICGIIEKEIELLGENKSFAVSVVYPHRLTNSDELEPFEWEKELIRNNAWLRLRYNRLTIDNLLYTPVLIFDQFEEVFTNPQSQEWTDKFFAWLQELSTDLCPQRIVKEIEKHISENDFPEISTKKYFKAIFSLRSEYVGKLDYWGLQRHYIPMLKNNRYLLRPLTIKGAKEVITQQDGYDGLNAVADDIVDMLRKLQRGKNYVTNNASELPCIPALLLSIVCSKAFEMTPEERSSFIQNLAAEKDEEKELAIYAMIADFYDKAVSKCGIPSGDMAIIEDVLVNNEGNRQRVSSHADALKAIGFSNKYLKKLEKSRLIRVIPEYNRDEDCVELVHDALCPVILKNKEQRRAFEEQAKAEIIQKKVAIERKKNRRYTNLICLVVGFVAILLTIFTTWSSSTGIKTCLTSISHDGIWTYKDLEQFNYLALADSSIIDDKDLSGGMTLRNNLAIKRVYYNLDSIGLKVENCENLQEIILGDDVNKANIEIDASCKSLKRIHIGENVSGLTFSINVDVDSLVFEVSPQNSNYKWGYCFFTDDTKATNRGVLWDARDGHIVYMFLHDDYEVPTRGSFPEDFMMLHVDSPIVYESKTFKNTAVDISKSYAYSGSSIKSYSIKEGNDTIGFGAFYGCEDLKSIYGFPIRIGWMAFSGCKELENIQFDSVIDIGPLAFHNCLSLKKINLSCSNDEPDIVDGIIMGQVAFDNCWNLRSVKFPKVLYLTINQWQALPIIHRSAIFNNCLKLEEVYLPDTIMVFNTLDNTIGEDAGCISTLFINCPNISKVYISPHSLFRIDPVSKIVFYKDIPVICNMAENAEWVEEDSLHYYKDGILFTTVNNEAVHIPRSSIGHFHNWKKFMGTDYYSDDDQLFLFPDTSQSVVFLPYVMEYRQHVGMSFPFSTNVKEIHTPFAEPRMWAKGREPNVCDWSDIVLYVPWGTMSVYEKDYRFRDFQEIREDSVWLRMYMTLHYAFDNLLSKPWKLILLFVMMLPIIGMSRKHIKMEKERHNITLKFRDALFTSSCFLFAFYASLFLLMFYIDYHIISLF